MPEDIVPEITCPKCGHKPSKVIQATACYITETDIQAHAKSSRLYATIYQLECPHCQNAFSVTVPAN